MCRDITEPTLVWAVESAVLKLSMFTTPVRMAVAQRKVKLYDALSIVSCAHVM